MSVNDLILLLLVAGGAFYAGYQFGRLKVLAERGQARADDADQPLPGPRVERPYSAPERQRSSPPPASAGNDGAWPDASGGATAGRAPPPRRSSKPPPAAAGLMGTGEAEKSDKRQK